MPDVTAPFGFPYPEDTDLVRDGAADIEALAEGVNDQLALGFVYVGTRYYTSSGTFAKADPFGDSSFAGAKMRAIKVRLVGGGGGGGGCAANPGAASFFLSKSGGGGGYGESFITDIASLDTSVTVTRGSGGAGGAAGNNAGSNGGASSFGALVSASGGEGASTGAVRPDGIGMLLTLPAAGGSSITADLSVPGSPASLPIGNSGFGVVIGDCSGGSHLAGGKLGPRPSIPTSLAGVNGHPNGGGGTGAISLSDTATAQPGGTGGNGIVIIDVFA